MLSNPLGPAARSALTDGRAEEEEEEEEGEEEEEEMKRTMEREAARVVIGPVGPVLTEFAAAGAGTNLAS
jgi:hypothetical protein